MMIDLIEDLIGEFELVGDLRKLGPRTTLILDAVVEIKIAPWARSFRIFSSSCGFASSNVTILPGWISVTRSNTVLPSARSRAHSPGPFRA